MSLHKLDGCLLMHYKKSKQDGRENGKRELRKGRNEGRKRREEGKERKM